MDQNLPIQPNQNNNVHLRDMRQRREQQARQEWGENPQLIWNRQRRRRELRENPQRGPVSTPPRRPTIFPMPPYLIEELQRTIVSVLMEFFYPRSRGFRDNHFIEQFLFQHYFEGGITNFLCCEHGPCRNLFDEEELRQPGESWVPCDSQTTNDERCTQPFLKDNLSLSYDRYFVGPNITEYNMGRSVQGLEVLNGYSLQRMGCIARHNCVTAFEVGKGYCPLLCTSSATPIRTQSGYLTYVLDQMWAKFLQRQGHWSGPVIDLPNLIYGERPFGWFFHGYMFFAAYSPRIEPRDPDAEYTAQLFTDLINDNSINPQE
jgi:hypothetical protein